MDSLVGYLYFFCMDRRRWNRSRDTSNGYPSRTLGIDQASHSGILPVVRVEDRRRLVVRMTDSFGFEKKEVVEVGVDKFAILFL